MSSAYNVPELLGVLHEFGVLDGLKPASREMLGFFEDKNECSYSMPYYFGTLYDSGVFISY